MPRPPTPGGTTTDRSHETDPVDDAPELEDSPALIIRLRLPGPPRALPPPPDARRTRVTTESGSVYLLDPRTMTAIRLRRDGASLRRDGEPLRLISWPLEPVIGAGMDLHLMVREDGRGGTIRSTTRVVGVEREP